MINNLHGKCWGMNFHSTESTFQIILSFNQSNSAKIKPVNCIYGMPVASISWGSTIQMSIGQHLKLVTALDAGCCKKPT